MFYNSNKFKVLEAGTNLAQMQQEMHTHNITNLNTPGFKAKEMDFQNILKETTPINGEQITSISADVSQSENQSKRPDGNNVDYETESLELYKSYVQYSMLLDRVKGQFNNYSYVLNSGIK